jgi:signal transduction histidine kinase/ActR/RegA family two-component response regulator
MGSSTGTDTTPLGSHDVGPVLQRPRSAAGLWRWLRDLRNSFADALRSDWPVAVLAIGVVLTIADPWNGRYAREAASAGSEDGLASIRAIANLVLAGATVLSAFVMALQRRALTAARQTSAQPLDTSLDIRREVCSPAAAARQCSDWQPSGDALARPVESCNAAISEAVAAAWQPERAELECVAELQPEAEEPPAEAAPAAMASLHAERMQALGQLAAGIAHDFNNLLTAVQGSASLIVRRADDPDATRRHAGMILDATARGQSITHRLLGFARREDSRPEPVDPRSVLHALHQIASHTLGTRIKVRVEATCPLPRLMADRAQLETTLVNLAINARDAMPEGGTLTFAAALDMVADGESHSAVGAPGTYIRLSVSDTGTGIDRLFLERVLEPFFTTKPAGQGTGLGLPMAKAFAEQSGGGLAVDSSPGRGTTVSLWLPIAPGGTDSGLAARPPKRVLLAEDDGMVSETLAAVLEDAGYAVLLARTGAEALAALRGPARVDALVTDLSIRELGGLALIDEAHRCCPGLPAILLTACPDLDATLAMKGAFSGAFSLLRKPVSAMHLVARIEALIAAADG